jgi:hypothetical protein
MNERASRARQRRGPGSLRDRGAILWGAGAGSLRNRGAFSWGAGAERATDERGPCEIAERLRGMHERLCGEVVR